MPNSYRMAASEINWRKITGLRNILILLIHEYYGISLPITAVKISQIDGIFSGQPG